MGSVKCLECNVILTSKSRHDFQKCKCDNETFVDGGNDYCRIGGKRFKSIKILDQKELEKKLDEAFKNDKSHVKELSKNE